MPRTAYIRRINPVVDDVVKNILFTEKRETTYKTILDDEIGNVNKLGLYVKKVEERELGISGIALFDFMIMRTRIIREGDELKRIPKTDIVSDAIFYHLFPELRGNNKTLTNVLAILASKEIVRNFEKALQESARKQPLLYLKFDFSPLTEEAIRREFDDIVILKSDDVDDERITGLTIKGIKLYETNEYGKAFTGKVKSIGVQVRGKWFRLNREGSITVYVNISDIQFLEYIKDIIERLLRANAVID